MILPVLLLEASQLVSQPRDLLIFSDRNLLETEINIFA